MDDVTEDKEITSTVTEECDSSSFKTVPRNSHRLQRGSESRKSKKHIKVRNKRSPTPIPQENLDISDAIENEITGEETLSDDLRNEEGNHLLDFKNNIEIKTETDVELIDIVDKNDVDIEYIKSETVDNLEEPQKKLYPDEIQKQNEDDEENNLKVIDANVCEETVRNNVEHLENLQEDNIINDAVSNTIDNLGDNIDTDVELIPVTIDIDNNNDNANEGDQEETVTKASSPSDKEATTTESLPTSIMENKSEIENSQFTTVTEVDRELIMKNKLDTENSQIVDTVNEVDDSEPTNEIKSEIDNSQFTEAVTEIIENKSEIEYPQFIEAVTEVNSEPIIENKSEIENPQCTEAVNEVNSEILYPQFTEAVAEVDSEPLMKGKSEIENSQFSEIVNENKSQITENCNEQNEKSPIICSNVDDMITDRQGINDISDDKEFSLSTLVSSKEPNFEDTDNVLEDRKTEESGIEDLKEEISDNKDVSKDIIIKEEEVKFTYVESHSEAASEVQDDNEIHDSEEKQTNSNIIKVQEKAKVIENGSELHFSISDKSKSEYISP